MEREPQKFQIPQMPLPEGGSPQSTPTIPERTVSRKEWFYANGPMIFKTDQGHFSEPIDTTQEEHSGELLSFDFDTAEGTDEAKQFAKANFTQAVEVRDSYEGKWPQQILRELFESIELQNKEIQRDLDQQRNFILGKSLEDKGSKLAGKLVRLNRSVDALYEMQNEEFLAGEGETAEVTAPGAEIPALTPEPEEKKPFPDAGTMEEAQAASYEDIVIRPQEKQIKEAAYRHLQNRVRMYQSKISSTLKALDTYPNLEERDRELLRDLISYSKALNGILTRGTEEAASQTEEKKVYSASLIGHAQANFEKIDATVKRLAELYPPQVVMGETTPEAEVDEDAIQSELSPEDEQELLEDYFLKYIAGLDSEEKRESVQKQLYMLSPNERAAALQDALTELYEESDVSTELVPAPQSAVDAMERLSALPTQEADADSERQEPTVPGDYEDLSEEQMFKSLKPKQKYRLAESAAWNLVYSEDEKKYILAREYSPGTLSQEHLAHPKLLEFTYSQHRRLFESLTSEQSDTFAEQYFYSLKEDEKRKYFLAAMEQEQAVESIPTEPPAAEDEERKTGWWNDTFRSRQDGADQDIASAEAPAETDSNETPVPPITPEAPESAAIEEPRTGWFNESYRQEKLGSDAEEAVATGEAENAPRRSGWWNPEIAKERARAFTVATAAGIASAERTQTPEEQAARAQWLAARKKLLFTEVTDAEKEQILFDHVLNTPPTTGESSVKDKLEAASTEEEKARIMAEVKRQMSGWNESQRKTAVNESLAAIENTPLQNKYQNKLTTYYENLKQEGNGFQRFGRRIAATFGFKPDIPPGLAETREEMFDATADYTKETREMLRLREESGKDSYENLSPERRKRLLEGAIMRGVGWHDRDGVFHSRLGALQNATTDTERAEVLAERDKIISELTPEARQKWIESELKRVQSRYEKMLGRSVLMGTFERQLEAQRQVTEDLAFQAPEVLKKHKRKISLFAAGAIGGITGGFSSAAMGVTRALAGGLLGATIGGFVGEKWKNRIERKTKNETEAVLDSLAQRLSKDSITAKELEDTYQELKKIYEKADNKTRIRIASLMAIALAVGLATGQALEFGAESTGIIDTPSTPEGGPTTSGSGEVPMGGATDIPGSETSPDGTAGSDAGQTNGGGAEGNGATAEALKPYTAEQGDNMWDILEGQTDADKLPFMEQVDPAKLQGLLKEVELKLDADEALRTEIGFGDSSHDLSEGATVNLERLNEEALKIAEEKGMLADANVAEAAAADASPEAAPTDSVETAAADASPEEPTPPTAEAAAEDAITKAEVAADKVASESSIAGLTAEAKTEGAQVSSLNGSEQVKAYVAGYKDGPLAFENQLVKPFVTAVEGEASNGFLGLFKTPPPPSMGGYALFQHVPLQEMDQLNRLPDEQLLPTLAEKYHVENPEQFSVWVNQLNDMQTRGVFDLNQTPDLTLADAAALDVINSKTTSV